MEIYAENRKLTKNQILCVDNAQRQDSYSGQSQKELNKKNEETILLDACCAIKMKKQSNVFS